ncbi:MAG TPA: ATP-binding cassette domain-containing protein [Desulfomonilia bacterium]|nr:ATP-binding cassette domain-containing protein [Desulfomonilia bacterium]
MVIECINVSYRYEVSGDEWALADLDMKIEQGENVVVTGPAGSGKTTFLQLLDALMLPTKGDILYDGDSVRTLARKKRLPSIRRRMGVLFQFPEDQFFQETAYDELVFAMRNFLGPEEDIIEQRAYSITQGFGLELDRLRTTSPFSLSSGEKRKLALASALMINPEILMLDEPTAGLDSSGRRELIRMISSLADTTVIIVTHNQEDFLGLMGRFIGITESRKVLDVKRGDLIDHIEAMESSHINAPLVLLVQHWLKQAGMSLDQIYYNMDELIGSLNKKGSPIKG